MGNKLKATFILLFCLSATNFSYSQSLNQFVEPNVSVSYNSNEFNAFRFFSNTHSHTETYDFKVITKSKSDITISVKANYPLKKVPSVQFQDSVMTSKIGELKKLENETTSLIENDKVVKHINDFLCVGFTLLDKSKQTKATLITCNHITKNDLTEITLLSINSESLSKDYETLQTFLKGFKSYSEEEILTEEKRIKEAFKFKVEKVTKKVENLSDRKKAYIGVFKLHKKASSKLIEIRIIKESFREIFIPEKNGEVYFACKKNDSEENNGEAVFINSFGKEVIIPFKFKQ